MSKYITETGTTEPLNITFAECLFIRQMLEKVEIKGKDALFIAELSKKVIVTFEVLEQEQLNLEEETQTN